MNVTNSPTPSPSCAACSAPVRTSAVSGRVPAIASISRSWLTPSFAATATASKPLLSSTSRAVATSKSAIVAPPRLSTSPKRTIPVSVYEPTAPRPRPSTCSPTSKPCSSAVLMSTTTSPGPDAQVPSTSLKGLNRSSPGSTPRPKVGLLPWIAFPSLSRILAWFASPERSRIVPAAASTSGRARTRASTSSETCAFPVCDHSTSFFPETTASVCSYELEKIESKAFSIVSVRTSVPLTIATPRTIAIAVRIERSLRAARPRSATRLIVPTPR